MAAALFSAAILLPCFAVPSKAVAVPPGVPIDLRLAHNPSPVLGVEPARAPAGSPVAAAADEPPPPRLSWRLTPAGRGVACTGYSIEAG
eukprot:SAG11_NODE_21849_length_417_cov_1.069182_1_plen_88_part_10